MATVEIAALRARYRLAPAAWKRREQLDRGLAEIARGALERALEHQPCDTRDLVCIDALTVPVRLAARSSDAALVGAWSAALAGAIATAATSSPESPGVAPVRVARFGSRRAALLDCVLGFCAGSWARRWAWAQLGLCPPEGAAGEPGEALCAALTRDPEGIVAVFAAVARAGRLGDLVGLLGPDRLRQLAASALTVAGVPAVMSITDDREPQPPVVVGVTVERSWLARALRDGALPAGWREARDALALLAALEADPALALAPDRLAAAGRALAGLPEGAGRAGPQAAAGPDRELAGPSDEPDPVPTTRYGGLAFFLGVIEELSLAEEIMVTPSLRELPLSTVLHCLALALAPVAPDDPAALAFANLPPGLTHSPLAEIEAAEVQRLADRIRARTVERLGDGGAGLIDTLAQRDAEVHRDPGWIELRFPLEAIDVAIRRAALDLDPGWLPWLGAVVRFVYG